MSGTSNVWRRKEMNEERTLQVHIVSRFLNKGSYTTTRVSNWDIEDILPFLIRQKEFTSLRVKATTLRNMPHRPGWASDHCSTSRMETVTEGLSQRKLARLVGPEDWFVGAYTTLVVDLDEYLQSWAEHCERVENAHAKFAAEVFNTSTGNQ
jgi:hypothetical protein